MADRTINININITGNTGTGGTTGGGSTKSGGGNASSNNINKQIQETETLFQLQKRLTKEYRATASASGEITDNQKKLKAELDGVNAKVREFNNLGKQSKNTWSEAIKSYQFKFNALGNIISNVVSQATQMLFQLGSSIVTISKDFEFSMSGVRAITNATSEEFKILRNDAIRLGGATIYTATEISHLQEELAKLGFSVKEIHEATDGVVALAQATGEDLSDSALTAGTMIRAFNMDAKDLTGVVDIMAQAFNDSALDLYKFSETMKYVGPVASKTGFSIAEVTALMAKLADQGIVASQAGTGLRNIMLRMANSGSALAKAMGGTAHTLPEMIIGFQKLNKEGIDSTRMLKLLDRYSVTAGLALAQSTEEIWKMYSSMVSSTGASKKMSETRLDNFAGEVEMLKGAWDSFVLTVNQSNSALRWFISGIRGAVEAATSALKDSDQKAEESANNQMTYHKERLNSALAEISSRQVAEEHDVIFSADLAKIKYKKLEDIRIKYEGIKKTEVKLDLQSEINLANSKIKYYQDQISKQMKIREKIYSGTIVMDRNLSEQELKVATVNLLTYTKYLTDLQNQQTEEKKKALVDQISLTEAEAQKAEELADKEANLRLQAMRNGLAKELQENKNHYEKLRDEAQKAGILDIDFTQVEADQKIRIITEYNQKVEKLMMDVLYVGNDKQQLDKEIRKLRDDNSSKIATMKDMGLYSAKVKIDMEKILQNQITEITLKYEQDRLTKIAEISGDEVNIKINNAKKAYFERKKWFEKNITDEKVRVQLTALNAVQYEADLATAREERAKDYADKQAKSFKENFDKSPLAGVKTDFEPDKKKGPNSHSIFGFFSLDSDQEQAIKKGYSFLQDEIQKVIDKEVELADRRVENSQRVVDQLQQDLQTEIALAQAGFASNVSLKQKELAAAKVQQEAALKLQEQAVKRQNDMQAIIQAANLFTTATEIVKGFTQKEPTTGWILGLLAASAMLGGYMIWKNNAKSELTQYGEGGEIDGPKHSQGGTVIEAEGGEFMVKASAYNNHKDLVQAINNEDMANVYRSLNQDLSVSLDDSNTARMLGRHFRNKKEVTYFNGGRVETIGNRRRTIRHA